jgi:hypothetical protein
VLNLLVAKKVAVLLLHTLQMREETDADTQRPHCGSSDYFSSDFKVHDFLPAVNTSNCWQYVWYLSQVLLPKYITRNSIVAYGTWKIIEICRLRDHPVLCGGVKSKKSVWGGGSSSVFNYGWRSYLWCYIYIFFALDNLCPPEISQMLRGVFCLLGQKYESLFIRPKKVTS